jgi:hypothetical protein
VGYNHSFVMYSTNTQILGFCIIHVPEITVVFQATTLGHALSLAPAGLSCCPLLCSPEMFVWYIWRFPDMGTSKSSKLYRSNLPYIF